MAKLILSGAEYDIRPFKLREIRKAAPAIDRCFERSKSGSSGISAMGDSLADMLEALTAGIDGATLDDLEANAAISDLPAIRSAFDEVLQEAGFKPKAATGEGEPAEGPAAP